MGSPTISPPPPEEVQKRIGTPIFRFWVEGQRGLVHQYLRAGEERSYLKGLCETLSALPMKLGVRWDVRSVASLACANNAIRSDATSFSVRSMIGDLWKRLLVLDTLFRARPRPSLDETESVRENEMSATVKAFPLANDDDTSYPDVNVHMEHEDLGGVDVEQSQPNPSRAEHFADPVPPEKIHSSGYASGPGYDDGCILMMTGEEGYHIATILAAFDYIKKQEFAVFVITTIPGIIFEQTECEWQKQAGVYRVVSPQSVVLVDPRVGLAPWQPTVHRRKEHNIGGQTKAVARSEHSSSHRQSRSIPEDRDFAEAGGGCWDEPAGTCRTQAVCRDRDHKIFFLAQ